MSHKISTLDNIKNLAERFRADGKSIVHCHGCFDIVHPGHVRYLQFGKSQGDILVVSLTSDNAIEKSDGTRPHIPQELRAENLAALECVDVVVICDGSTAQTVIQALRPDFYVKGKEYENSIHQGFLEEKLLVESLGGRVIYSSGEVIFSSGAILEDYQTPENDPLNQGKLQTICNRWNINQPSLIQFIRQDFQNAKVLIVGDSILDKYIACDTRGVAAEAPILSVQVLQENTYLGGAAIIAAHIKALGGKPHLVTTTGSNGRTRLLREKLTRLNIPFTFFPIRKSLPCKIRYIVGTQKLLKVDDALVQPVDSMSEKKVLSTLNDLKSWANAAIFADFGCGTLTQPLLAQALPLIRPHVSTIAGDISGIQRTLLAYRDADFLTPTEQELRAVVGDFERTLPGVAIGVMKRLRLGKLAVTMGPKGCLLFSPREENRANWFRSRLKADYLPALTGQAVDQLGAGDAYLAASTMAINAGATLPQAGYLGSAAAAIAVKRIGNSPVGADDLASWVRSRPELRIS